MRPTTAFACLWAKMLLPLQTVLSEVLPPQALPLEPAMARYDSEQIYSSSQAFDVCLMCRCCKSGQSLSHTVVFGATVIAYTMQLVSS